MHFPFITLQWRHNERDGVSNRRAPRLCVQPLVQAQIKDNIKASRHWPLWGEPPVIDGLPPQRASNTEKKFPFDDVAMIIMNITFGTVLTKLHHCIWSSTKIFVNKINSQNKLMHPVIRQLAVFISQHCYLCPCHSFNTLRPRQDGRHFSGDIFKRLFMNENVRISIEISVCSQGLS